MKNGFSLFEILIYLSISSLMLVTLVSSSYPLLSGMERSRMHVLRTADALFVHQHVRRTIENAASIIAPASGSGDTLVVISDEGYSVSFMVEDAVLMRRVGSEEARPMTSSRILINNLHIERQNTMGGDTISVSFTMDGFAVPTSTTYVAF